MSPYYLTNAKIQHAIFVTILVVVTNSHVAFTLNYLFFFATIGKKRNQTHV